MEFIDIQTHYRRQIGFIGKIYILFLDFLVLPIWKSVSNIFPELMHLK
jgi:hypothetical protein